MRHVRYMVKLVILIASLFTTHTLAALTMDQEAASVAVADNWLQFVDQGEFGKSWDVGASQLKATTSKTQWESFLKLVRGPLDSINARKMVERTPSLNPVGLLEGDYMVIVYQTTFAGGARSRELVTLAWETDGSWRALPTWCR